mmetsp:Transcript_16228/g.18059  ORF Transcript_16228/g.18059 Transcript_16228/m.18059 type:complete len:217 (-) Transcript_16228:89-739(-)
MISATIALIQSFFVYESVVEHDNHTESSKQLQTITNTQLTLIDTKTQKTSLRTSQERDDGRNNLKHTLRPFGNLFEPLKTPSTQNTEKKSRILINDLKSAYTTSTPPHPTLNSQKQLPTQLTSQRRKSDENQNNKEKNGWELIPDKAVHFNILLNLALAEYIVLDGKESTRFGKNLKKETFEKVCKTIESCPFPPTNFFPKQSQSAYDLYFLELTL